MGLAGEHRRAGRARVPLSERLYARAIALAVASRAPELVTLELLALARGEWNSVLAARDRCAALAAERPELEVAHRAFRALEHILDIQVPADLAAAG